MVTLFASVSKVRCWNPTAIAMSRVASLVCDEYPRRYFHRTDGWHNRNIGRMKRWKYSKAMASVAFETRATQKCVGGKVEMPGGYRQADCVRAHVEHTGVASSHCRSRSYQQRLALFIYARPTLMRLSLHLRHPERDFRCHLFLKERSATSVQLAADGIVSTRESFVRRPMLVGVSLLKSGL